MDDDCRGVLLRSILGAIIFECSWWSTGGGYRCALPIFLALFCNCYGRSLLASPLTVLQMLSKNVKENVLLMYKEEKQSVVLMVSYFILKCGLKIGYPEGEKSNGSPISLIMFTFLFISIYIVPLALRGLITLVSLLKNSTVSIFCNKRELSMNTVQQQNWKLGLKFYSRVLYSWKQSITICAILVLCSYFFDCQITALLRFLGKGKPCWPLLLDPDENKEDIPQSIVNVYPWHIVFPKYHPVPLLKSLILIGRELGEVCHLLPMLIGVYILSQLFLPPENSLIKKTLFASIAGVVMGGVISGSFKILFHRYRPNAYGDPYMWKGPGMTTVNHLKFSKLDLSFPAGHTTVTSAVATCWYTFLMLSLEHVCSITSCTNLFVLLCIYANPLMVLLSRVSECCHWTSDATFGVR